MRPIDGKELADTLLGEIFDRGQESARYEDMLEIGAMSYTDLEFINGFDEGLNYVYRMIENAPTIDAEPVRQGHWVRNDNGTYSCSECHSWIPNEQHYYARYCLFCGAKMDMEEQDATD
jgi:hypothetical protein